MELHVVLRRLADRRLALVQPAELRADVGGAGAIAILWEPTLFVLANAQPPNHAACPGEDDVCADRGDVRCDRQIRRQV